MKTDTTYDELAWWQKFIGLFLIYFFILSCATAPVAIAVFTRNMWWASGYFISLPLLWATDKMIELSREKELCQKQ